MDLASTLQHELAYRQMVNARYSLRSFARDLGLPPSTLSEILKRKKGVSAARATRLLKKVRITEAEKQLVLKHVEATHSRSQSARRRGSRRLNELLRDESKYRLHTMAQAASHWAYFAVLECLHLKDFRPDVKWIAKRLGVKTSEVERIVRALEKLDLIERGPDGWRDRQENLSTTDDIPSQTIRQMHLSLLERAKTAISQKSVEDRLVRALIFAIPNQAINEVRAEIRALERRIIDIVDQHPDPEEVQCVSICQFALSEKEQS